MDKMEGKLIRLRPHKEEDYEFFAALKNDLRTQAWNQRLPPRATVKTVAKWVEKEYERSDCGTWSIETLEGELVGHIGYGEGSLRFAASIGVITGVDFWGRGTVPAALPIGRIAEMFTSSGTARMSRNLRSLDRTAPSTQQLA